MLEQRSCLGRPDARMRSTKGPHFSQLKGLDGYHLQACAHSLLISSLCLYSIFSTEMIPSSPWLRSRSFFRGTVGDLTRLHLERTNGVLIASPKGLGLPSKKSFKTKSKRPVPLEIRWFEAGFAVFFGQFARTHESNIPILQPFAFLVSRPAMNKDFVLWKDWGNLTLARLLKFTNIKSKLRKNLVWTFVTHVWDFHVFVPGPTL